SGVCSGQTITQRKRRSWSMSAGRRRSGPAIGGEGSRRRSSRTRTAGSPANRRLRAWKRADWSRATTTRNRRTLHVRSGPPGDDSFNGQRARPSRGVTRLPTRKMLRRADSTTHDLVPVKREVAGVDGTAIAGFPSLRRCPMKPHAAVLSSAALLGLVSTAGAAPGDPRVVQGTVEWAEALSVAPFVVVRGDDGRFYYTDVSRLQGARLSLSRGERVVVTGVEGMSPHELAAVTLQSGVAPSVALTPPPSPVPSPPPAAPAPLPLPAPVAPPAGLPPAPAAAPEGGTAMPAASPPSEPAAHRLDGRVQSITGNLVVLK